MFYLWRADGIFKPWIVTRPNNVYGRWITTNISGKWKRTANSTTVDSTSGWKSSPEKIYQRNSARARTSTWNSGEEASNGTAKATLTTRDRGYSDHKYVQRRQQNTTITLQTKPTKRGNFFDATIGNKNYIICKTHMRNIFPTDWGHRGTQRLFSVKYLFGDANIA